MTGKDPRPSTAMLFGGALALTASPVFNRLPGLTPEQADSIRRYAAVDGYPRFRPVCLGMSLLEGSDDRSRRTA